MKDNMTRWFRYAAEDAKAAQAELDELADQGWELVELGIFTASFQRAERPRRCWVEPARWKSIRRKDEQARSDYLALCHEAGWDLLDEAGGMFYFRAKPDACPAPLQTDGSMEWEEVLKKSLWDQAYFFFGLVIYWVVWTAACFFLGRPRVWELFLSNGGMIIQLLLLVWIILELFLGIRVVRYRKKCRRAVEAGQPVPAPGRGAARFRGAMPLLDALLGLILLLSIFSVMNTDRSVYYLNGRLTAEESVLAEHMEFRRFSSEQGDLWIEAYDCKTSWLVEMICRGLRADEVNENQLRTMLHGHGAEEPLPSNLGYDQAWTYEWEGRSGLIFRQNNRVVHMEAEKLDLTDKAAVEDLLIWLEQAACTME